MTTVKDLENRVEDLEEKVLEILASRRWLLRAIAGVALVTLGQIVVAVIQELAG